MAAIPHVRLRIFDRNHVIPRMKFRRVTIGTDRNNYSDATLWVVDHPTVERPGEKHRYFTGRFTLCEEYTQPTQSIDPWLIAIEVVISTFVVVLDTTIANVGVSSRRTSRRVQQWNVL